MSAPRIFPLYFQFPQGKAWAAIRCGCVVDMAYMDVPECVPFHVHRQRSRARLAAQGKVVTGEVVGREFVARADE